MFSTGFDTIAIDNNENNTETICEIIYFFARLGIKNFLFIRQFDFTLDSVSLRKEKMRLIKKRISPYVPRGTNIKFANSLIFTDGIVPSITHLFSILFNSSYMCILMTPLHGCSIKYYAAS